MDQLRNPGPRNYYIDCFSKMEPPDNYDEIFEYLRSHTIGEAYADKMLLLLLMLVSQYETHIFLDHDLAKETYPDLLDRDLTELPVADLLEISKKLIVTVTPFLRTRSTIPCSGSKAALMLICISFLRSRRSWLISCLSVTASSG